jgi:meso-butanediol dehydrogenase / (S,S)-butanediol dehydrogenase / diacetyl reductase
MKLRDRVTIVTGGGSGIGRAIALRAAREGAAVVVADIAPTGGQQTVADIEQMGERAMFVACDVSRSVDTQRLAEATLAAHGRIDVLVNNAAVGEGDDVLGTDEQTWDRMLSIVLKSVYLCSRAVLPSMLEQRRGAIVNISSVNGMLGLGMDAYGAAKAGVINLTQNMAVRYGGQGIRANAICPGTVRTPIWQERVERAPDIFERLSAWYPVGRVGEPDDVAAAAIFLASDEASFVNGAILPVDGGLTAGIHKMARELLGE